MKLIAFLLIYVPSLVFAQTWDERTQGHGTIDSVRVEPHAIPLLADRINNFAFSLKVYAAPGQEKSLLRQVTLKTDKPWLLQRVKVVGLPFVDRWITADDERVQYLTLGSAAPAAEMVIEGELRLTPGENLFYVSLIPDASVDLSEVITVGVTVISDGQSWSYSPPDATATFRMGKLVRAAEQDHVHTYRIPGLVTTGHSTLIAVYDVRYNNNRDLQEDIDVGMSRSTDGGQTWEPMKIIMDMGSWGGLPESRNGIGDPAVLYDPATHMIWVAALWVHGGPSSIQNNPVRQKGLVPGADGSGSQIMLVKSEDDGQTWSAPINITSQVKKPEWGRFLQGPGSGITMEDGTLVFASQYFDLETKTSWANIMYSTNHGQTWHTSAAAVPGGSEAQVAELPDGRLMLNIRSDRKARLVATTGDMGLTWQEHPSSATALPEPGCMASLIGTDLELEGEKQRVLVFSNPDHTQRRLNMTLKVSRDLGQSWPQELHTLLNETSGYGYSCLTMVNDSTVGILYEGLRDLIFQTVNLDEIIKQGGKR